MRGIQKVYVRHGDIRYNLSFERNVSVICGDSGTGKSTLIDYIDRWLKDGDSSFVHVDSSCNISVIHPNDDWYEVLGVVNTLFFVDEYVKFISDKNFVSKFYESGNYIVIISRSGLLNGLEYSINSIYHLESVKADSYVNTVLKPSYVNTEDKITPDVIISEGEGSDFQMLSSTFPYRVIPAKGKENVKSCMLENRGSYSRIYMVVDGAIFGMRMIEIAKYLSDDIKLFAPESFEYLLLSCNPLYSKVKDYVDNPYKYVEYSSDIMSYERYFTKLLKDLLNKEYKKTYTKSRIPEMFLNDKFKERFKSLFKDLN